MVLSGRRPSRDNFPSFAAPAAPFEPRRSSRGSFPSFAAGTFTGGSTRRGSYMPDEQPRSRRSSFMPPSGNGFVIEESPLVGSTEAASSIAAPRLPARRPARALPEESPISSSFGRIDWSARQAAAKKTAPKRKEIARDGQGETVLHRAARTGNIGQVERFLKRFDDPADAVHLKSEGQRRTPLHIAAENGHTEIASRLLAAGGPFSLIVVDADGFTAVGHAIAGGHVECLRMLLQHDFESSSITRVDRDGDGVLHMAVRFRQASCVGALLEVGADACAANRQMRTPLHSAAMRGLTEIVKLLLEAGADPTAVDRKGDTPLSDATGAEEEHTAADDADHAEVIRLLKAATNQACALETTKQLLYIPATPIAAEHNNNSSRSKPKRRTTPTTRAKDLLAAAYAPGAEELDCSICMMGVVLNPSEEAEEEAEQAAVTACGHVYHLACWQQMVAFAGEKGVACPNCRDGLTLRHAKPLSPPPVAVHRANVDPANPAASPAPTQSSIAKEKVPTSDTKTPRSSAKRTPRSAARAPGSASRVGYIADAMVATISPFVVRDGTAAASSTSIITRRPSDSASSSTSSAAAAASFVPLGAINTSTSAGVANLTATIQALRGEIDAQLSANNQQQVEPPRARVSTRRSARQSVQQPQPQQPSASQQRDESGEGAATGEGAVGGAVGRTRAAQAASCSQGENAPPPNGPPPLGRTTSSASSASSNSTTSASAYSRADLEALSRRELQAMAKAVGITANKKSAEIIERLAELEAPVEIA